MTPAQLTLVSTGATVAETPKTGQRDRYLDLLIVVALAQVMVVHVVPFVWYPAAFPAVGIVFAITASRLASSLDRSQHRAFPVIKRAVLRLLAPLWVLSAVLVPPMVALGWTNTGSGQPLEPASLLKWLVPISPPPASDLGHELALPFWTWALSCFLWLLLLSPVLLWLFRRWPKRTVIVPLALLVLNALGVVTVTGDMGGVVLALAAFGTCWLLGFAHHDGALTRTRLSMTLVAGIALYGIGIACAYAFPTPEGGLVPDQTPLAYGFLSIGLVLMLLRLHPLVRGRLGTHRFLAGLVTAVNRRAVTVYLWGNACLTAALYLIQSVSTQTWWPGIPQFAWPVMTLALSGVLVGLCAICFGWVEDKAAGRPARLNPWPAPSEAAEHSSGRRRGRDAVRDPRQASTGPPAPRRGRHRRRRWSRLGRGLPS